MVNNIAQIYTIMKYFIYILVFLTACNASIQETSKPEMSSERMAVESEKEKVMEIHDVAMEKMGEMLKLKTSLKGKISSLDSSEIDAYRKAIEDLEDADKTMWDWMHGYKAQIVDSSSTEIALEYLKKQKVSVDIVAEKIESSLKNGYELLEK